MRRRSTLSRKGFSAATPRGVHTLKSLNSLALLAVSRLWTGTGGRTLEDAFITLTGHSIREAGAAPVDRTRMMRRVWRGRR